MANCYNDCLSCYVCQYVNHDEYDTVEQLKNDCRYCITADVAPKSEVDWHREAELNAQRIIELEAEVERLRKVLAEYEETSGLKQAKAEVARGIFAEIEKVRMQHTFGDIDGSELNVRLYQLKKKYTEEQK